MNWSLKMNVHLLASREDNAGMNIAQFIHSSLQKRITVVENISIFSDEEVANFTPAKSIIYLSRHSAQSLRPSFTVRQL